FNKSEDKYLDDILDFEEKIKANEVSPSPGKDHPKSSKAKKYKKSKESPEPSVFESLSASLASKPFDNYMHVTKRVLVKTLHGFLEHLYAQVAEDNWAKHEEVTASYADLKWEILTKDTAQHVEGINKILTNTVISPTSYPTTSINPEAQVTTLTTQPITKEGRSLQIIQRVDKGKAVATKDYTPPPKLVTASREVRVDPNGGKYFIKHHGAHLEVLTIAHTEKLKQKAKVRKKLFGQYVWTTNNKLKPERITDIFIYPNTKLVAITVYKNNDPKNFDVYRNFKFSDFGISKWDELSVIIPKKKNKVVSEVMTSLSNKYERLMKIPSELKLNLALPLPEQDLSLTRRKRKVMELEPETYIVGLHCNKELPKRIKFVNNLVIEEPEHGLFFIDAFEDEAFQRVNYVHKVETETLLGYKVMALNVKTDANQRFSMLMSKMINERPDKEKIMSKRVKLENLGYTNV
ncbi:hypothetical protein Tco_0436392, partial [Tanacetum coccineum]